MTEPGWYADPAGRDALRWWDGTAWTPWMSQTAGAPPPVDDPVPVTPATPAGPPGPRPAAPGPGRHASEPPGRVATVRLPVALLIGVGAVLLAVLAVAGAVRVSADPLPTGAPVVPTQTPAGPPASEVAYDQDAATVAVRNLHAETPAAPPYTCEPDVDPPSTFLSSWIACEAPVHRRYNKTGNNWNALVAVGVVERSAVRSDPVQTSDAVQRAAVDYFYGGHPVTLRAARSAAVQIGTAQARETSVQVHFRIAGLATTYDDLVLLLVPLDSGEYVIAVSAVPEDSSAAAERAAAAALRSVRVA